MEKCKCGHAKERHLENCATCYREGGHCASFTPADQPAPDDMVEKAGEFFWANPNADAVKALAEFANSVHADLLRERDELKAEVKKLRQHMDEFEFRIGG